MEPDKTDQEKFDEDVKRMGKVVLPVAAGLGIAAALLMSVLALTLKTSGTTTTVVASKPVASPAQSAPMVASVVIDHVTRGCHALSVNGSLATSPDATVHLAAGGSLNMQNNDVMPHKLLLSSGGSVPISGALMNHMGATSSVTFPTAGTYTFTTKPGEDYMPGVTTVGEDNTLKLTVVVGPANAA